MQIDHLIIHIDNASIPLASAAEIRKAGFPFDPKKGKGTKGFRATNIWVGQEYFEIIWLLKPDGGGWVSEWVEKYNRGIRGVTCLFLRTDTLNEIADGLTKMNVKHRIERTSFKIVWGLFSIRMPWRVLLLEAIPGTNIEIGFIQYDPGTIKKFSKHMIPNSRENGFIGISHARINVPDLKIARAFLSKIFSNLIEHKMGITIPLQNGSLEITESSDPERLILFADSHTPRNQHQCGFHLEDVRVDLKN